MHRRSAASARRLRALTFCAASVPAVLILPRVGWLWACGASILSAVLLGLCTRRPPCLSRAADGARLVWTLLVLGAAARRLCAAFPQRESVLIGLLLLLLAVYASARGESVLTRAGTVCCLLLLALYAVLLLFSLPTLHRAWLRPQLKTDWTLLPYALLPLAALPLRPNAPRAVQPAAEPHVVHPVRKNRQTLRSAHRQKDHSLLWLGGGVLLTTLCALVTAGGLSPQVAAGERFPFYGAMKSVKLLGVMERLEPLASAALTVGGFALLGLLCAVSARCMERVAPGMAAHAGWWNLLGGLAAFALAPYLSTQFFAVGTTIFWGLLPLAELIRGFEKNIKKS